MKHVFDRIYQKARKQHRCYLCGCAIEPGEKYVKYAVVDCGFFENKGHVSCDDFACATFDDMDWECIGTYGDPGFLKYRDEWLKNKNREVRNEKIRSI